MVAVLQPNIREAVTLPTPGPTSSAEPLRQMPAELCADVAEGHPFLKAERM
jgi:hypothetical protein